MAAPSTKSPKSYVEKGPIFKEEQFYVEREADKQLPQLLLDGEFCYVLGPRQIGKSSLRQRVARKLQAEHDIHCVHIDLTGVGRHEVTLDEWLYSVGSEVVKALGLSCVPFGSQEQGAGTSIASWLNWLRVEVLAKTPQPIVIFLDEIDMLLDISFSMDFFAAVRSMYQSREQHAEYRRLTFCLLGVAAPSDLCRDPARTPFNIAHIINLPDFTLEEARVFESGLVGLAASPSDVLAQVMAWSGGHPAFTQLLCKEITHHPKNWIDPGALVESLVRRKIVGLSQPHWLLAPIGRAFDPKYVNSSSRPMLMLYSRLLRDERVALSLTDELHLRLQLVGLCGRRSDRQGVCLVVRNRIVATAFDQEWVTQHVARLEIDVPFSEWKRNGRRPDFLLRGPNLRQAKQQAEQHYSQMGPEILHFLILSQEQEYQRDQKWTRGLRVGAALAVIAVGALLLWIQYRLNQRELAANQQELRGILQSMSTREKERKFFLEQHDKMREQLRNLEQKQQEINKSLLADCEKGLTRVCELEPSSRKSIMDRFVAEEKRRLALLDQIRGQINEAERSLEVSVEQAPKLQQNLASGTGTGVPGGPEPLKQLQEINVQISLAFEKVRAANYELEGLMKTSPQDIFSADRPLPDRTVATDEIAKRAERLLLENRYREAVDVAKQSSTPIPAHRIIGTAACYTQNLGLLRKALSKTNDNGRKVIAMACRQEKIEVSCNKEQCKITVRQQTKQPH